MKLLSLDRPIDLALLPIGGRTTMDPLEAILAVEWIAPRYVAPIHYNTWDFIRQDPEEFKRKVDQVGQSKGLIMPAGEYIDIGGDTYKVGH